MMVLFLTETLTINASPPSPQPCHHLHHHSPGVVFTIVLNSAIRLKTRSWILTSIKTRFHLNPQVQVESGVDFILVLSQIR